MTAKRKIEVLDTTLRDGSQGEGVSFSVNDKLDIAKRLDEIGVNYIEAGWPSSNPKDAKFFDELKAISFGNAKATAFGSTRRAKLAASEDPSLKAIVAANTPVVTLFGKTWGLHVDEALRVPREQNLEMITDSIVFVRNSGRNVIFDAEHFFDGYKADADYAISTLKAAVDAGATHIVLCDTNGGTLPREVFDITKHVMEIAGEAGVGIHTHNDAGLAVANTLAAVEAGASQIHGTINGLGERCGNADLCVIVPTLAYKYGFEILHADQLQHLTELSRFVDELALLMPRDSQPYVGRSAFAHKGGVHVDAVQKNPVTYEHISPELIGNERRILISELSGRSNVLAKTDIEPGSEVAKKILTRVQELESLGYQFEAAEASFDILTRRVMGTYKPYFRLEGFRVITELDRAGSEHTEATIKVSVNGEFEHTAAEGNGPVNALDTALRKGLIKFYKNISDLQLINYKVRIVNPLDSTAAKVLVLIESRDKTSRWTTAGVHENVIEASWIALVDSVEYKLIKDNIEPPTGNAQQKEDSNV